MDIIAKPTTVYKIDGKHYLRLYGACLYKAKRTLVDKYARFDGGDIIWHYSLMQKMTHPEVLEDCTSYQDVKDHTHVAFNVEKYTKMKCDLAKQYLMEYKANV